MGPLWPELRSGLRSVGAVPAIQQVGCSGRAGSAVLASPCPLCRLFVPRDWRRWRRCTPGWPAHPGSRGGGPEWPPVGPPTSLCCPHHPSLLSPLPQTCHPPLGLAGKRQRDGPCRGWLQRGRAWWQEPLVAPYRQGPGVCVEVTPSLLDLGTQQSGELTPPPRRGGCGGTPRQEHPAVVRASLPWGGCRGAAPVPQFPTKGYNAFQQQQQQQFTEQGPPPPPPCPRPWHPPGPALDVALPHVES